jgi:peptide/nickel transport system permease protein
MTARALLARVGQAVIVLLVAYTASFLLLNALPGDGVMIKFENPEMGLSPEQIAKLREYYGADVPVAYRYLHALDGTLRGDFGYSIENGMPVRERIAAAAPQTLVLATLAFLVALVVAWAVALGAFFSRKPWLRTVIASVPSLFISIPTFWLGIVLIQIVSFELGWVPVIGGSEVQRLILPVITLAVPISAPMAQIILRTFDDVRRRPFMHVVEAKGASQWWLLSRHAARNSLLPILTISGLVFAELLSGSVVTETVFNRNGLGSLTNKAVQAQDLPVLQAIVVIAATLYVVINLVVDLLYPVIDPRLRARSSRVGAAARAGGLQPIGSEA